MPRLGNIKEFEQRKAAAPPVGITPQSQSVREGFQQMGQFDAQQPVLQKQDPNKMYQATRSQALSSEAASVSPEKTMGSWNASPYEYWTEQVKANPDSTYAILNQMNASQETPEEKAKRERREQLGEVFNNLGNVIGNAANLYYTTKGGQYIDLNTENEKRRERMRRIKEKQDALKQKQDELLGKAKMDDIRAARDLAAKKEEREYNAKVAADKAAQKEKEDALNHQRELIKLQIQNAYKMGQIDAQTKARLTEQANKLKNDKELEAFKQTNRLELNDAKGGGSGKKKSTYTYNGVVYNKGDLSSMVNLYNKLRYDGYAMPKVKGNNVNQYVDAIANSMSKGTWNMGDFSKGADVNYPNIIDSDMNQGQEHGRPTWKDEDETNKTDWD